jgi:hypothetical protein
LNENSTLQDVTYAIQQFKSNPQIIDYIADELFTNKSNEEFANNWISVYAPEID